MKPIKEGDFFKKKILYVQVKYVFAVFDVACVFLCSMASVCTFASEQSMV